VVHHFVRDPPKRVGHCAVAPFGVIEAHIGIQRSEGLDQGTGGVAKGPRRCPGRELVVPARAAEPVEPYVV
jgi:hypothetical protein